jgi:hypothetical protein
LLHTVWQAQYCSPLEKDCIPRRLNVCSLCTTGTSVSAPLCRLNLARV